MATRSFTVVEAGRWKSNTEAVAVGRPEGVPTMASESPQLVRSLFGYRTSGVRQILADRERMFLLVQGQAQQAHAKVEQMQAELDSVRAKLREQAESTDEMLTRAQAELESATEVLRARSEQVEAAESRAAELNTQLEMTRAELRTARTELRTAQAEPETSRAELRNAETELETTRAELRTARAELETTGTGLRNVRMELETTRTELQARSVQARAADARSRDLQTELETARTELAERDRQVPIPATEELSVILEAAERGVSGIMERTKHAYEDQLAQAERERQAIRSEIDRFGDWQAHVEPRVRSIQRSIETARDSITRVPQLIQEAVGSMVQAITGVSDSLDRLATLPGPLAPLEEASDAVERLEGERIDVIRLQDRETDSADADGPSAAESNAHEQRDDRDQGSARPEDGATADDDPHWAHWGPRRSHGP
jgi:DNA repair exonuclease SbcCD ATPase subunit